MARRSVFIPFVIEPARTRFTPDGGPPVLHPEDEDVRAVNGDVPLRVAPVKVTARGASETVVVSSPKAWLHVRGGKQTPLEPASTIVAAIRSIFTRDLTPRDIWDRVRPRTFTCEMVTE